jgi:hypothetical protein
MFHPPALAGSMRCTMAQHETLSLQVEELFNESKTRTEIREILLSRGHAEELIQQTVEQVFRIRNARRMNKAMVFILAGAVFLVTGFLCSILFEKGMAIYTVALFGFTSLGIILLFVGLVLAFG